MPMVFFGDSLIFLMAFLFNQKIIIDTSIPYILSLIFLVFVNLFRDLVYI